MSTTRPEDLRNFLIDEKFSNEPKEPPQSDNKEKYGEHKMNFSGGYST